MLDVAKFIDRMGGNEDVVRQVMKMIKDQYTGKTDLLREPFSAGDHEALFQTAHSVKGALANVCAEDDAAFAAKIELAAREGNLPSEAELDEMKQRLDSVLVQIDEYLSEA